jgi:hypothetical protein
MALRGNGVDTSVAGAGTRPALARPGAHAIHRTVLVLTLTAWTTCVSSPVFGGPTSTTTSTSSRTTLACPAPPFAPDCVLEGQTLICVTTTTTFGPACIGIGDRNVANALPCTGCSGCIACEVPPSGTPFCVAAGNLNVNTNTDTTTFLCQSTPAPALSAWGLAACAGLLLAYAARRLRASRATRS